MVALSVRILYGSRCKRIINQHWTTSNAKKQPIPIKPCKGEIESVKEVPFIKTNIVLCQKINIFILEHLLIVVFMLSFNI